MNAVNPGDPNAPRFNAGSGFTGAAFFRFFVFLSILTIHAPFVNGQSSKYAVTCSLLQTLYNDEIQDHLTYLAYAKKALSENYPNIAYFFVTLANSEYIHARNYKKILLDLGMEANEPPKSEIRVCATKENLKNASQAELDLIDQKYPKYLEKVKSEPHEAAIRYVTFAWEGDRQHRDLIEKVKSGTGIFFGSLIQKIEKAQIQFYICQVCGFPNEKIPIVCPISKSPGSKFKEVEMMK